MTHRKKNSTTAENQKKTLTGESEPVSELPEEDLVETSQESVERDADFPPPRDTAPEPPGEQFAGEGENTSCQSTFNVC